ncbi:hypothetical protein Tco_1107465 [Tanacetum coccineum]
MTSRPRTRIPSRPRLGVSVEYGLCEALKTVTTQPENVPKDGDFGFYISECEKLLPTGIVDSSVEQIYKELPKWEESKEGSRDRFRFSTMETLIGHPHLFFVCPFSNYIWDRVKTRAGIMSNSVSFDGIVAWLIPLAKKISVRSIVSRLLLATSTYYIWQERNGRIFKKRNRSKEQELESEGVWVSATSYTPEHLTVHAIDYCAYSVLQRTIVSTIKESITSGEFKLCRNQGHTGVVTRPSAQPAHDTVKEPESPTL